MSDEYSCNLCGKLTDIGYFYCEECHRMHREKRREKEEEDKDASVTEKEVFNQIEESESKQL